MFCPNCGAKNADQARFCGGCGRPFQTAAAQPAPAAPPVQQPLAQPAYGGGPVKPLSYKIFGDNLPAVAIRLDAGESIYTQSGGMTWMDAGIVMETNMKGGLMKGLGRMFSGDSLFIATYTASRPNQEIVLASSFPGNIAAIDVSRIPVIAQKSAFLCAQPSVSLSAHIVRGLSGGLFGGEGFVLQRLSGIGMAFIEIDGSLVERVLAPGETIKVDTGNVAAYEESVQYQAEMVKGFKNILFGGEGLFLTTLIGPGRVWLQTMTLPGFARQLLPFLPKSGSN
ncbi:MAG: TIGR00266 family protein [Clostridiaceae bacterium]|nr:TIGR00266 family protein [Clostridiaceae bacterium]